MATQGTPNPLQAWVGATKGKMKASGGGKSAAAARTAVQAPPPRPTAAPPLAQAAAATPPKVPSQRPVALKLDDGETAVFVPRTLPPPQKIKPMETLWMKDFGEVLAGRLPWLKMTGYIVELRVNSDVLDVLAKEDAGATSGLMIADAQEICAKFADQFVAKVESLEGGKHVTMQELQKQAQDVFKALHPKLVAEVEQVPRARWIKFQRDKPMWKEYKMQTGANVAIGTLEIAVGAASIAAAVPTMGATLPLAVVETARGLFKTITEVGNYVRSAESDQAELLRDLESLKAAYLKGEEEKKKKEDEQKKMSLRGQAQEFGAILLKGFLGANVPLFGASLQKCNEIHKRWKPKVAHLRVLHGRGAKEALDFVTDAGKLESEVEEMKKSPATEAKAEKVGKKVVKMRELATKGLDKVSDLGGRILNAEKSEEKFAEGLEELNKAEPDYLKIFNVLFPAAVSIGLAAGSAGLEIAGAEETIEVAKSALQLAEEVLLAVKEAVD